VSEQKPLSILLVDDEADACEIIRSMLAVVYPQLSIHTATNGQEGLEIFTAHKPEIVITDINMPELDGIQLLQKISVINPGTRLIVVTAFSDRQNLDRITSTGIKLDHVAKPVDFELLFASINRCIAACEH
jgi:YesN/AraC family two-component response regulator